MSQVNDHLSAPRFVALSGTAYSQDVLSLVQMTVGQQLYQYVSRISSFVLENP